MFKRAFLITSAVFLLICTKLSAQSPPDSGQFKIRLNQIGFYPSAPKIAAVLANKESNFFLQTTDKRTVLKGKLKKSLKPNLAGNYTFIADFSNFQKPGNYILNIPGIGNSYPFNISGSVHKNVADASIKAFYFIRASIPLE